MSVTVDTPRSGAAVGLRPAAAMVKEDYDVPRYVIVSARVSPMVELARWLFERHGLPYAEEAHAPLLHAIFTRRRGGGVEVPVVWSAGAVWSGAGETLAGLDGRLRDGERLFGESPFEREANQAFADRLLDGLLLNVRRLVYFHLLPFKRVVYRSVTEGAPGWERGVVRLLYRPWRHFMGRALDFSPEAIESARARILETFALVESALSSRGTRFLHGDAPGTLDIVFAALTGPLLLPERYGASLPRREDLPAALRAFVDPLQARPAGQLALATYEHARPVPQPRLARPRRDRTLLQVLVGPSVQRLGARLAARVSRPVKLPRLTLVTSWTDVRAVLESDLHHHVAPVNGPAFEVISGPFVLGLDRGDQFARERAWMYAAVSPVSGVALRSLVAREAARLLDTAGRTGRIDVAHGYAHPVAARTAVHVFGIPGPTEGELHRVCRALFHYSFLNQANDPRVEERARRAAKTLRGWVAAEVVRRRQGAVAVDDVLGRLMAVTTDDDAVRRIVTGLLVGAIDTTSTTLPRIIAVLASDPGLLRRVERDVGDAARMAGWCAEALRMWPSAPLLFRRTAQATTIAGRAIGANRLVGAFTQAAMYDPQVFPRPMELDPARPRAHYFNFGGGLHPCAGRGINDVQLPELVSQLVSRGIEGVGRPRFVGPFLDELVVTLRRSRQ